MKVAWDKALKALCVAGGAVAGWFGELDTLLIVLCAFMGVDYLTGLIAAWLGKSGKSATGVWTARRERRASPARA